ncbi:MAG: ATP-binding protein [Coriobacteriia bacterium]|nr:ATP-binding protein [Coriobacteriia bacterium]
MADNDALLHFVSSVANDAHVKVEETLGDGFVRLNISEAERRQAKHDIRTFEDIVVELLRNSRDAHARRIFVANSRDGEMRSLTVLDDGVGVPRHLHEKIFEPRVTSKLDTMVTDRWGVHGRGMALFSVRSNVADARVAASDSHKGMALSILSDTTALPERADQSSWPSVGIGEDGRPAIGTGPHNIVRRVVEFAVEHPEVEVYIGTPTEIVATLHILARDELDSARLLFCDDPERLAVWQRPAACADAAELVRIARSIGLAVSERTAHRVLGGEAACVGPVLHLVMPAPEPGEKRRPDIFRDRRGLRVHHTDLSAFRRGLEDAFDVIGERYYVHMKGEPRVTIGRDSITVRYDIEKED